MKIKYYGLFITGLIDFILMAFVVFLTNKNIVIKSNLC